MESYHRYLISLWQEGEGFLNVEQDIQIHRDVIPQLSECTEPWCAFGYAGPSGLGEDLLTRSLGCTRFSTELLKAEPGLPTSILMQSWRRLDAVLGPRLMEVGYQVHVHEPPVLQHHVYDSGDGPSCACGGDHEPYPVDHEGRYRPEE